MISFHIDDFIEQTECRWIATLNDGREVFADDDRPGIQPASAWIRLNRYIQYENNNINALKPVFELLPLLKSKEILIGSNSLSFLSIVGLRIYFRGREAKVPDNQQGYFFSKAAGAVMFGDVTHQYYIIGYIDNNGVLRTSKYKIPELLLFEEEERQIDVNDERLIINNAPLSHAL